MPLNAVNAYLKSKLAPNETTDTDCKTIANFLDELLNDTDYNSIRLLICIGIDVKTSIKQINSDDISVNSVLESLRKCILLASKVTITLKSSPHNLSPRLKFAIAQRQISPRPYTPCISCVNDIEYFRVYNFRSYMLYVVSTNRKVNPNIGKIDPYELDLYKLKFNSNRKYKELNITELGKNQWVFVADKNEVESIGYGNPSQIVDGLGLYTNNTLGGTQYVGLEYDSNFKETTYQPDTLTGDWGNVEDNDEKQGNDYFLSYFKFDNFGRTYSVSGSKLSFRERVHRDFNHLGKVVYKMKGEDLGSLPNTILKVDAKEIIKEAYIRFMAA